jgi:hypothetical protein
LEQANNILVEEDEFGGDLNQLTRNMKLSTILSNSREDDLKLEESGDFTVPADDEEPL